MLTPSYYRFLLVLGLATVALFGCQTTAQSPPDRFAAADTNHNGVLSRDEVAAYISNALFDAADTNKDGKLTAEEWKANGRGSMERFRAADANHDGVVTRDEAHKYAARRPVIERFMKEADTNKDGVISREEAKAYYGSREGSPR